MGEYRMLKENDLSTSVQSNYWKRIVFTFCLGWTIIWIYRAMLSPIYSEIQGTIGHQTNEAMGIIASCYFFGYTALHIPSGFLVDKFGQKKVLIPGFIIFALGALGIGLSKTLTSIYIGSVCAGIGCGTYYGAAFSLTAQHVPPEKKGFSTAIVNSGSALGLILGMTGSSYIVKTLKMPWQTMAFISAALIFLLVVWFIFAIKNTDYIKSEKQVKTNSIEADNQLAEKNSLFGLNMISCYILYFCTSYAYYMIVTWLPKFLQTERGIKGGLVGFIVSMISVTAVPGALFFARMSDKKKDKKEYIIIGLEVAAFVLVAVSMFAPNTTSLAIILLLYGFLGKMAADPVLISYVSDKADKKNVATTLGMFNFFGMASSIVAPAATGIIMDKTGSGVIGFYVGAVLLVIGVVLFVLFNGKNLNNIKVEV
jgi:MFS family permease